MSEKGTPPPPQAEGVVPIKLVKIGFGQQRRGIKRTSKNFILVGLCLYLPFMLILVAIGGTWGVGAKILGIGGFDLYKQDSSTVYVPAIFISGEADQEQISTSVRAALAEVDRTRPRKNLLMILGLPLLVDLALIFALGAGGVVVFNRTIGGILDWIFGRLESNKIIGWAFKAGRKMRESLFSEDTRTGQVAFARDNQGFYRTVLVNHRVSDWYVGAWLAAPVFTQSWLCLVHKSVLLCASGSQEPFMIAFPEALNMITTMGVMVPDKLENVLKALQLV